MGYLALSNQWAILHCPTKAAATEFAKRGASLTIVGRNEKKTMEVLSYLKAQSGNEDIHASICDLGRVAVVKRLAENFMASHDRLDVLVNNAGATFKEPKIGPDGLEITFELDHLSYFELTVSLLDLIRNTPHARVVSTSSSMQARGDIRLDKIATSLEKSGPYTYANAKLANILFTKELQRRLDDTTSVANCFEPGMVNTSFGGFGSDQGFLLNILYFLAKPFSSTPEQGADTLVWLATSDEALSLKGEYVSKRKPIQPQKQALDEDLAKDLWRLSQQLCDKIINK